MPINEYGAEVINGYAILQSEWNELQTARKILAFRMMNGTECEFVVATAGKVGVTEWHAGNYSRDFDKAKDAFKARSIPGITQQDVTEWFAGWRDAGYPYMGSEEHNRHILMADGRIASVWTNSDNEFPPVSEDDVIQSVEEWGESFHAWQYDY